MIGQYDVPAGLQLDVAPRLVAVHRLMPASCTLDGAPAGCAFTLSTSAGAVLGVGGPSAIKLSKSGLRAVSLAPGGVPVVVSASLNRVVVTVRSRVFVQGLKVRVTNSRKLRSLTRTLRHSEVDGVLCRGSTARRTCRVLRNGGAAAAYRVAATRGPATVVITYDTG